MFILSILCPHVLFLMVPSSLIILLTVWMSLLRRLSFFLWLFVVKRVIYQRLKTFIRIIKPCLFLREWLIMANRRPRPRKPTGKSPRKYYVGGAQF